VCDDPAAGLRDDLDLFASWIHHLATDVPLDHAYDLPLTFPPGHDIPVRRDRRGSADVQDGD
jgi:hypothetical protein